MASSWWEITGDRGMYNVRHSETDPRYPPRQPEDERSQRNGRGLLKEGWSLITHEFITERGYAGQKSPRGRRGRRRRPTAPAAAQ